MTERPILFSAPMIRALLAGTKTQTRRVVKPQPSFMPDYGYRVGDALCCNGKPVMCPYGHPGNRLWVRETWRIGAWDEDEGVFSIDYCDGPDKRWRTTGDDGGGVYFDHLWQQSCDELDRKGIKLGDEGRYHWQPGESPLRWRPSIHMPRCFSRITLEIVSVRVERLQDISESDALSEGVTYFDLPSNALDPLKARTWYRGLWESINGTGSWAENPWVWVLEFRRVAS